MQGGGGGSQSGSQVTLFSYRQPGCRWLFVSILSCWLVPILEKQELPIEPKTMQ